MIRPQSSRKCRILVPILMFFAAFSASSSHALGTCDPHTFGAKGDGIAKDTSALQAAIDACAQQGGGVVRLSAGIYLTAPVEMKTNITLQIDKGATFVQISEEAQEKSKAFMMKIQADPSSDQPSAPSQTGNNPDILNLSSNASRDQIRRAYKGAIKQYHPDNFANFCSEFQKLAEEKCKEINLAYQKLTTA